MADRKGILRIDPEMMIEILGLPDVIKVESVLWDLSTDTILFKLSGGDLPLVDLGGPIPDVKFYVSGHNEVILLADKKE